jgi:hypothetical protein
MLYYPKIPSSKECPGGRCLAFEKYDGTNLHWDWDRDFGWHAFGTRRDAFNLTPQGVEEFHRAHPMLEQCVERFQATLADGIDRVFREHSWYQAFNGFKVFTEYCGPNSFAGRHRDGDPMETILFDVLADQFGLVGPRQFVDDFGHLHTARVVYEGTFTGQFAEDVRRGKYGVVEGVVCKGGGGGEDLWLAKVKTYAYLERLKKAFGEKWEEFWE